MTARTHDEPLQEALDWAARIEAPGFDDWEAHIAWLEADPSHPALYQRASAALSSGLALVERLEPERPPTAANDSGSIGAGRRVPSGWWFGAGAAIAASVGAFLVLPQRVAEPDLLLRTAPGVTRSVTLAGGTSMILNGDTRLRVIGTAQRRVVLAQGEVFLRVAHDARNPFEVLAGGRIFRDVGTEFNITAEAGTTRLAVAEGAVAVDPDGRNVRIDAGKAITIAGAEASIDRLPPSSVGSWRTGRLVYANDELRRVASDLSRSLGVPVTLAPDLQGRRFTGVLALDGKSPDPVRRLADLLGASASQSRSGWTLSPDEGPNGGASLERALD